jgi:hypothetical protein
MPCSEHHEILLAEVHLSGAEEWTCPTCGRRFLVSWTPSFKRIIIEAGDEYVTHSGGKGGVQMGAAQLDDGDQEPEFSDELRAALDDALSDIDFEDWEDTGDEV